MKSNLLKKLNLNLLKIKLQIIKHVNHLKYKFQAIYMKSQLENLVEQ